MKNSFQSGSNEEGEDQKKRSSSQKFYEIRCESTIITKIRAVNTNLGVLGLNLHSNSHKLVNFFVAQSSLGGGGFFGGGTSSHLGGMAPKCPYVALGLVANRMILTIDVCLMLNCFLLEKFYLHYAMCDFDFIL